MLQAVPSPSSPPAKSPIASIPEIVEEIRNGRIVVLVDDEDRENEGDLIFAADFVTPEKINFLAKYGRGLVCMPITAEHAQRLRLAPMAQHNRTVHGTNFTVAIEAAEGVTTGISAADRAHTIRVATRPDAKPEDIVQPGHVFPLVAQPGGVLMRAGHTEAGCDLARMAGLTPAAVICEVMKDDGTMARLPDLERFAAEHGLKIGTIADLIGYRSRNETLVQRMGRRSLETPYGRFDCQAWRDHRGGVHLSLVHGQWKEDEEVLVRAHEPFTTFDLLDAGASGHSWPLGHALRTLQAAPHGVALLLNCSQDAALMMQQLLPEASSAATARDPFDLRTYGVGAQILRELGVRRMRLMSNPRRMPSMAGYGLEVTGFVEA